LAIFPFVFLVGPTLILIAKGGGETLLIAIFFYINSATALAAFVWSRPVRVTPQGVALPWKTSGPVKRYMRFDGDIQAIIRRIGTRRFILFVRGMALMDPVDLDSPRCLTTFYLNNLGNPAAFLGALRQHLPVSEVFQEEMRLND